MVLFTLSPRHEPAATPHLTSRRARRVRWLWLAGFLILYAGCDLVDVLLIEPTHPILATALNWGMVTLVGVTLLLLVGRQERRILIMQQTLAAQQRQAEQLATQLDAVQATARAVAHNLNQPLAAIQGYAELLRDMLPAAQGADELTGILAGVSRAVALVRQLSRVTRYQTVPTGGGSTMLDLSGTNNSSAHDLDTPPG